MVLSLLREIKDHVTPAQRKGEVIQDLEFSMRAKGGMRPEEETKLHVISVLPKGGYIFASGFAYYMGKVTYLSTVHAIAVVILQSKDEQMKMELANIILTKHSGNKPLVQVVKRHFFAEHLFDDLHQDKPLFRWHPRRSYVDSAFVERMKEIEATNSYDEAKSISRQTTPNVRSFGDLTEDPFACILGAPGGGMEGNTPPEKEGTILKRSELWARRRTYWHHHHRHANKLTAS